MRGLRMLGVAAVALAVGLVGASSSFASQDDVYTSYTQPSNALVMPFDASNNRQSFFVVSNLGGFSSFGNQTLAQGSNRDFASLCVAWLLDRPQSLAIGPKPLREWRLNLSESTLSRLRWILLAGLPGSVLLLGVIVWARRRS